LRTHLRPEPRPGGRIKKAAKQQTVEPVEQERPPLVTSPIADPNDWRPARPTKACLMAGR
jgi:hypothetical protein